MADPLAPLADGPGGYVFAFVVGALFGSFANVVVLRVPRRLLEREDGGFWADLRAALAAITSPPSHCFACRAPVRWFDNLPLLSWLALRGRCRACGARFSPRYLLVEAAMALLFVAVFHYCTQIYLADQPAPLRLARFAVYAAYVFTLVVIAFIDLDHKLIPDAISYPAIPAFYGLGLLLRDHPFWHGLVGLAVGYGVVRVIADAYRLLTKREGLGYGDGKLLAIVGALHGWQAVAFAIFAGSLLGSVIGVLALTAARRRRPPGPDAPPLRHVELPFGPFLVAAALAHLFLQDGILVGFSLLGL